LFLKTYPNKCKISDNSLPNRARVPWNNESGGGGLRGPTFEDEETQALNSLKRKRDAPPDEKLDPKLKEFLGVMQRPSLQKSWVNEGMDDVEVAHVPSADAAVPDDAEEESEEEYQTISKKAKTKKSTEPSIPQAQTVAKAGLTPEKPEDPGAEADGPREGQSDADWLRSKTSRLLGLVDEEEERPPVVPPQGEEDTESETLEKAPTRAPTKKTALAGIEHTEDSQAPTNADEEAIRGSSRLFLRNLPYTISEDDVTEHFAAFGNLEEVRTVWFSYSPFRDDQLIGTTYASANDVIRTSILVDASHI
jgi:multiple RNA-binding domain-containing protein 1